MQWALLADENAEAQLGYMAGLQSKANEPDGEASTSQQYQVLQARGGGGGRAGRDKGGYVGSQMQRDLPLTL